MHMNSQETRKVMLAFDQVLKNLSQEELNRYAKKLNSQEYYLCSVIAAGFINRISQVPAQNLNDLCKRKNPESLRETLITLFTMPDGISSKTAEL